MTYLAPLEYVEEVLILSYAGGLTHLQQNCVSLLYENMQPPSFISTSKAVNLPPGDKLGVRVVNVRFDMGRWMWAQGYANDVVESMCLRRSIYASVMGFYYDLVMSPTRPKEGAIVGAKRSRKEGAGEDGSAGDAEDEDAY